MIPEVTVSADENPEYSTDSGKSTIDKVFLLSIKEANKYLNSDSALKCQRTEYCCAQSGYKSKDGCTWWLRSPGYLGNCAAYVLGGSLPKISSSGMGVRNYGDVRPALWINTGF